jgi:toxin CptA
MSIAASAIVVPSRRLRALSALFGLSNLAAACAVGLVLRDRYQWASLCAGFFLAAVACVLHGGARSIKTHRIDVSGPGQLRLTVQQDIRINDAGGAPAATAVTLLDGSTVWPQLMLLLLRSENGALTVLPVLRDSVTPQQFRALAVALRAAGGRNAGVPDHPFVGTHKIL